MHLQYRAGHDIIHFNRSVYYLTYLSSLYLSFSLSVSLSLSLSPQLSLFLSAFSTCAFSEHGGISMCGSAWRCHLRCPHTPNVGIDWEREREKEREGGDKYSEWNRSRDRHEKWCAHKCTINTLIDILWTTPAQQLNLICYYLAAHPRILTNTTGRLGVI